MITIPLTYADLFEVMASCSVTPVCSGRCR